MIDLTDMNIMFTLNGEMLISDSGSELAFKDIEIGDGKCAINISCSLIGHSFRKQQPFLELIFSLIQLSISHP